MTADNLDICINRHKGSETSNAAFAHVKTRTEQQRDWLLSLIRRHPDGLTSYELLAIASESAGKQVGINQITPRLSELAERGFIFKQGTRKNGHDNACNVWKARVVPK